MSIPLVLAFKDWPVGDRKAWADALQPSNGFGDGGAFSEHSKGSLKLLQQGYAQWLSYLARTDPDALGLACSDRVSKERVNGFVAESAARGVKFRTIAIHLRALKSVLRAFGCPNLVWLHRKERRTYRSANPTQLKPPLPVDAATIFAWSVHRLEELDAAPLAEPLDQAVAWRQALMVGIQIACPVRLRAMVAMTVDWHVVPLTSGFTFRWLAEDMKTRKYHEMPLPKELVFPLRRYIDQYRPILLQDNVSPALWISARGNPLNNDSYQGGLAKLTEREFGISLRPHAFRHIAATTIAEKNPAEAGIIKDLLTHSTIRTSEMYYNRAENRAACRRLQDLVDKVRKSGTMKKAPKPLPPPVKPLSLDFPKE